MQTLLTEKLADKSNTIVEKSEDRNENTEMELQICISPQ